MTTDANNTTEAAEPKPKVATKPAAAKPKKPKKCAPAKKPTGDAVASAAVNYSNGAVFAMSQALDAAQTATDFISLRHELLRLHAKWNDELAKATGKLAKGATGG